MNRVTEFFSSLKDFFNMHSRVVKIILSLLNMLLVITLFVAAAFLFITEGGQNQVIFGHSLYLVKNESEHSSSLVFVKEGQALPAAGSSFLYKAEDGEGLLICTVIESAGDIVTFCPKDSGEEENALSLSIKDPQYGGQIGYQSRFFGNILAPLSGRQDLPFVYLLIGGVCILCLMLLGLIYALSHNSKKAAEAIDSIDAIGKDKAAEGIGDLTQGTSENAELVSHASTSLGSQPAHHIVVNITSTEDNTPSGATPSGATPSGATPEFLHLLSASEERTSPTQHQHQHRHDTEFIYVSTPVPEDDDDDIPSIESLMAEINSLGGDWDEDLKIYTSKKPK